MRKTARRMMLAMLCLGLAVLGCSSAPSSPDIPSPTAAAEEAPQIVSSKKKFVVGVSWQGMTAYVKRLEALIKTFAEDSSSEMEFLFLDGQNNSEKQISHVENFIAHKVDVILLNPCSYHKLTPAVEAANNAGVPLITIITRVLNQEKCTSFVGSDHKESGVLQGMLAGRYLEGVGNLAVLEGTVGIEAQLARTQGYQEAFSQYPYLKIAVSQPAFWEQDEAYMIVENWLYNGVEMDAILSQNDNMALGALQAVQEAGLAEEIIIFGIDGDRNAVQSIREGGLAGTVFMDAYSQAERIFQCLDILKEGGVPEPEYLVPFIVVTKENVNNTSIKRRLQY